MSRWRHSLILCLLGLALSTSVTGATYYVGDSVNVTTSGTPSDANNGLSWSAPWASIKKVNASTGSGDTVYFATGTWRDTTLMPIAGTTNDRTCYADSAFVLGYPARIYGADSIGGWTQIAATNVYLATHTPAQSYPTLFQSDSVLFRQADSADVDAAGEWWFGNGNLIAYVYNTGAGYDPDNYDMEITVRNCVNMSRSTALGGAQDHITLWGLYFRYANDRGLNNSNSAAPVGFDTVFVEHCYFSDVAGWAGINPSLFYTDNTDGQYEPVGVYDAATGNRIRACSLGNCYAWTGGSLELSIPQTFGTAHGDGITFYSWRNSVVDSCNFWGHKTLAALYFKCAYNYQWNEYDTVRFNTFDCSHNSHRAISIYGMVRQSAIYGNIFIGPNNGVLIYYYYAGFGGSGFGYHKIYNNTFYNVTGRAIGQYNVEEGCANTDRMAVHHEHSELKYNVIMSTGAPSYDIVELDSLRFWDVIDSNIYYYTGGYTWGDPACASNTFAEWQAKALTPDAHSTNTTDPAFNDAANADFSRPSASNEMSFTYGGKTWTIYGAIQNQAQTGRKLEMFINR